MPSEPYFVADPRGVNEDGGWLFTYVSDVVRRVVHSGRAASVALSRLLREGLVDAPEGALRRRL